MKSLILKPHEIRCLQNKGEVLVVRALPKQPELFGGRVDGRSTFRFFKNKREWIDYRAGSFNIVGKSEVIKFCPFGVVGERRYVKERWSEGWTYQGEYPCVFYEADKSGIVGNEYYGLKLEERRHQAPSNLKWKSANTMPQWASRFAIETTRIDCRPVQSISEEEALQSGVKKLAEDDFVSTIHPVKGCYQRWPNARVAFEELWQSQHKKPPIDWNSNPFVWFVWVRRVEE